MTHRHYPRYNDDADFTTNAPSYYEDLARKEKLIRLLAERIWGYEEILDETLEQIQERFRAWDKNLEDFPEDVKVLLQNWLDDGTLDHIINDTIFNWKLDTAIFEQFRDTVTAQLQQTMKKTDGIVSVTQYAAGDELSDDTNGIRQAITEAQAINGTLVFPHGFIFRTTDTIYLPISINVEMNSPIVLDTATPKPAIVYGVPTATAQYKNIKLWAKNKTQSNWTDYSMTNTEDTMFVGVKLMNMGYCKVEIVQSIGFTIGLECNAKGDGFYYNEIHLGELKNNASALEVVSESGWPNGNDFYEGTFSCSGQVNPNKSRKAISSVKRSGTYYSNSNKFHNPRFEGGLTSSGTADCIPIQLSGANYWSISGARGETFAKGYVVKFTDGAINNSISFRLMFTDAKLFDETTNGKLYANNNVFVEPSRNEKVEQTINKALVFDSGLIKENVYYHQGDPENQTMGLSNLLFYRTTDETAGFVGKRNPFTGTYKIDFDTNDGFIPNAWDNPGIKIDTSVTKKIIVENDSLNNEWGLNVGCFDALNNIIALDSEMLGGKFRLNYWAYTTNSPTTEKSIYFTVPDYVKSVVILPNRYTRRFKVYTLDGFSKIVAPTKHVCPHFYVSGYSATEIYKVTIDSNGSLSASLDL